MTKDTLVTKAESTTLKSHWRVFTNSKSLDSAKRISKRVTDALNIQLEAPSTEPYYKGGHVLKFTIDHTNETRPEVIFNLLYIGQRIAGGWQIKGPIEHDPCGWSNEGSISGLDAATWRLMES